MPQLTLNGKTAPFQDGRSILETAHGVGVTIPTLCYHRDLSVSGSCRLCLVEVEGHHGLVPACAHPAQENMVVHTETPTVVAARRFVLELLLRPFVENAVQGPEANTEFMRWVKHYGARAPEAPATRRFPVNSDANPFLWVDLNQCILCTRCVRACAEVQGRFVWGLAGRGADAHVSPGAGTDLLDARCESCGACVAYCPTGALDDKMSIGLGSADKVVSTTCGYCGVGCGLDLHVKENRVIRVTSYPDAPVNGSRLCVKGRYGYDFVHHPDRLQRPRVRRYLLEGVGKAVATGAAKEWVDVDWPTALTLVAKKLVDAKQTAGPSGLGVLSSAKCTNEENYLMQKFARQVLGTHNVDHCARLCHSSTVAGLQMALGTGAMSNSMADIAAFAQAFFLIGSNVTEQHPVFGTMLRQAVLQRGARLVVADPRRIDITEFAHLHLRQRPGTDVALINGLMHLIVKNGWQDADFVARRCEGFEQWAPSLESYTPERVAEITGVSASQLLDAAKVLATSRPMAVIWAMGITQHTTGVLNVLSLANLQLLLGNLGVPGGGVNPLRGQNNVQGACDMGGLPNVFPGYQSVADPAHAAFFSTAWATEPAAAALSCAPGLTLTEMIDAFGAGRLRALYVLGEDLATTEPHLNHTRAALAAGAFLVLQEIFPSETAEFADVLLPGVSFAEKDGTFTNTERRVQLVRQAVRPPGDARQDWAITANLACAVLDLEKRRPQGPQADWRYTTAADIFEEVAAVTPSYRGILWSRLQNGENLHWPAPHVDHPGTPILHVDSFPRGQGKFHAVDHLPAEELPSRDYPFLLTTGRVLYHWHGGELTRRARTLLAVYPETLIEINPDDAVNLSLRDGGPVRVRSCRGEMLGRALITERVAPGVVFGNFHFPNAANVNNITNSALDPVAKIPEYKVCAVAVEAVR